MSHNANTALLDHPADEQLDPQQQKIDAEWQALIQLPGQQTEQPADQTVPAPAQVDLNAPENQENEYGLRPTEQKDKLRAMRAKLDDDELFLEEAHADNATFDKNEATREELREASLLDKLTGLPNRAAFDVAIQRADRAPDLSIVEFDGDNFGKINKIQQFGYKRGDQEIIAMSEAVAKAAAQFGVSERSVFRLGGDEFVVIAPNEAVTLTSVNDTDEIVTEKMSAGDAIIRTASQNYGVKHFEGMNKDNGRFISTDVSLTGFVGNTFDEADAHLQAAKQSHKDKVAAEALHQAGNSNDEQL